MLLAFGHVRLWPEGEPLDQPGQMGLGANGNRRNLDFQIARQAVTLSDEPPAAAL